MRSVKFNGFVTNNQDALTQEQTNSCKAFFVERELWNINPIGIQSLCLWTPKQHFFRIAFTTTPQIVLAEQANRCYVLGKISSVG